MTSTRKWNLEHYENNRQSAEDCLENALLCEAIAAEEVISDPAEAIFWQKKSLAIRETLYGKNSTHNILQYEKLTEYYMENGSPKSALPIGKKLLKIRLKALGNNHIEIAGSNLILAEIYSSPYMSDYHNAMLCAKLAAEIETVNRCHENPVSYKTHLRLAYIYDFRRFQDYQSGAPEPEKTKQDEESEKEHYRLAMESAVQEYGEYSVEAAICYGRYAHIIESCTKKRLALCAKAIKIFYQTEGAKGDNLGGLMSDICNSWTDVRFFPWEKNNHKGMQDCDRKGFGYGIKWIAEHVSKEIADVLIKKFDSKDQAMIYDILHSSEPIPPAIR